MKYKIIEKQKRYISYLKRELKKRFPRFASVEIDKYESELTALEQESTEGEYYEKVIIKTKTDLPEKQDYYTIHFLGSPINETNCLVWTNVKIANPSKWEKVDWYLRPVE